MTPLIFAGGDIDDMISKMMKVEECQRMFLHDDNKMKS